MRYTGRADDLSTSKRLCKDLFIPLIATIIEAWTGLHMRCVINLLIPVIRLSIRNQLPIRYRRQIALCAGFPWTVSMWKQRTDSINERLQ